MKKIICIQEEEELRDPIYDQKFPPRISLNKSYSVLDENLNYYVVIDNLNESNAFRKEMFEDHIPFMRNKKIENILN